MASIDLKVDEDFFLEHVKRICRRNLQKKGELYKCCQGCFALGLVVDIMDENEWKYNEKALAPYIKRSRKVMTYSRKKN